MRRAPGAGGAELPGPALADTAQGCAGMGSRAARGCAAAADAGAVPHAPRGAGHGPARRLPPAQPLPLPGAALFALFPLGDNQQPVRNPLQLRAPCPRSPALHGEHTLF